MSSLPEFLYLLCDKTALIKDDFAFCKSLKSEQNLPDKKTEFDSL